MQHTSLFKLTIERQSITPIVGIDEVGVAPLAGPVVAAAVLLPSHWKQLPNDLRELNDSKLLRRPIRERLYTVITESCVWSVGIADVNEIDRVNILQATFLAMQRAVRNFTAPISMILVDGIRKPPFEYTTQTLIDGDAKCASIAAASVIAKVTRDRLMQELHAQYPMYGWESNVGYGTPFHLRAIKQHGITELHRRSFRPVRECLPTTFVRNL